MFIQTIVIGHMALDAVLKEIGTTKKCSTAIGYSTGFGEKKKSNFLDVEAWGQKAELIKAHCPKGSRVQLVGSLIQNTWGENENKRSKHVLVVEQVIFLSNKEALQQAEMPFGKANSQLKNATPEGQAEVFDLSGLELPF